MKLFTIGFTKKSAETFFELLKKHRIDLLIDVRLNNKSQLAGFTKGPDLAYFINEIVHAKYIHCDEFAPTKDLLDRYHKGSTSWDEYVVEYQEIMKRRGVYKQFFERFQAFDRICLLCSEPEPDMCHRRLLAELLAKEAAEKISIMHI